MNERVRKVGDCIRCDTHCVLDLKGVCSNCGHKEIQRRQKEEKWNEIARVEKLMKREARK